MTNISAKWVNQDCQLPQLKEGNKCVTTNGKKFAVANHDFTKSGVIPSVTLLCDTPDSTDGNFYQGQVYVGTKDAIL